MSLETSLWRRAAALALFVACCSASSARADTPAELRQRAKTPPREPERLLELGRELRQAGLTKEAVRVLHRGYSAPRDLARQLRFEAARALMGEGEYKPAIAECRGLRRVDPALALACEGEAHLVWKRASLALPMADKALALSKESYEALVVRGRAQALLGLAAAAELSLREALKRQGTRYEAHLELGRLLLLSGKRSAGISELRLAVRAEAGEVVPKLALAQALGRGAEAHKLLTDAIAIAPSYAEAHAELGWQELVAAQPRAASKALERALKLEPKQADWHARLARARVEQGDAKGAISAANSALKLVKNHPAAKLVIARALALRGDIDLAIPAFEAAVGQLREDPEPLVFAARACLANARPTTALAFAERATEDFPKFAPGWDVLGDVRAAAGEKAAARGAYKRALSGEGSVDRAAIKRKLAAQR